MQTQSCSFIFGLGYINAHLHKHRHLLSGQTYGSTENTPIAKSLENAHNLKPMTEWNRITTTRNQFTHLSFSAIPRGNLLTTKHQPKDQVQKTWRGRKPPVDPARLPIDPETWAFGHRTVGELLFKTSMFVWIFRRRATSALELVTDNGLRRCCV